MADPVFTYSNTNGLQNAVIQPNTLTACPVTMQVSVVSGATLSPDTTAIIVSTSLDNNDFFAATMPTIPASGYYVMSSGTRIVKFPFTLSANVGECFSGVQVGNITFNVSAKWLSGNKSNGTSTVIAAIPCDTTTWTLSTLIYPINLPFGNYVCQSEQARLYVNGEI